MKTSNKLLFAALALGGALFAQSCEEIQPEQKPQPIFPETVIEKTIKAGDEKTEFTINPNMDWKVEIKGEGVLTNFWIIDRDGMPADHLEGSAANDVKFIVEFSEQEEFDIVRECNVYLTMNNTSKLIGTLKRLPKGRALTMVKIAQLGETGFNKDKQGGFVYDSAEKVELSTFPGIVEYSRPIMVQANYDWVMQIPQWCKIQINGQDYDGAFKGVSEQVYELTVIAILNNADKINGTSGHISFNDEKAPEQKIDLAVSLPAFAERIELDPAQNTEFNEEGKISTPMGFQEMPAIAYVLSTEDVVYKALPWEGEWYGKALADWVTFESGWNNAGEPLQKYDLSMSVLPYEAAGERAADILVLPKSKDSEDINTYLIEDGSQLKEEYKPYLLNRLTQTGKAAAFLTSDMSAEEMEGFGASLVQDNMLWPVQAYGAKQGFMVTYTSEWAGEDVSFKLDAPVDHYEVIAFSEDPMRPEFNVVDLDNFWLTFTSFGLDGKNARINMDPNAIGDLMPEAVLLLYTEGATDPIAAVHCKYSAELPDVPGSGLISISTGKGTITKLGENDEWYWNLSSEFGTQEVYEVTTSDFGLSMKLTKEYWNILLLEAKVPYEDLSDNSFSVESMGDVYVYVGEQVTSRSECVIIFKDELGLNMAAVHYIYDPDAAAPAEAPFEFAYPTLVQNAKLEAYTGDMNIFMGDFGKVDPSIVMQLTYTGPESQSILTVPGLPSGEGPYTDSPWLTFEQQGENEIMINMANEPLNEIGYFVWYNDMSQPKAILVCTRTAVGWE